MVQHWLRGSLMIAGMQTFRLQRLQLQMDSLWYGRIIKLPFLKAE